MKSSCSPKEAAANPPSLPNSATTILSWLKAFAVLSPDSSAILLIANKLAWNFSNGESSPNSFKLSRNSAVISEKVLTESIALESWPWIFVLICDFLCASNNFNLSLASSVDKSLDLLANSITSLCHFKLISWALVSLKPLEICTSVIACSICNTLFSLASCVCISSCPAALPASLASSISCKILKSFSASLSDIISVLLNKSCSSLSNCASFNKYSLSILSSKSVLFSLKYSLSACRAAILVNVAFCCAFKDCSLTLPALFNTFVKAV